jgi:hypothetical protein
VIGHHSYFMLEVTLMPKKRIRLLYLISLGGIVLGAALMVGSLSGGTWTIQSNSGEPGNLPLFIVGGVILGGACILIFVTYIISLIKMAQNEQWTWFVISLVFNFGGVIWSIVPGIIWSFFPDTSPPLRHADLPGNQPV